MTHLSHRIPHSPTLPLLPPPFPSHFHLHSRFLSFLCSLLVPLPVSSPSMSPSPPPTPFNSLFPPLTHCSTAPMNVKLARLCCLHHLHLLVSLTLPAVPLHPLQLLLQRDSFLQTFLLLLNTHCKKANSIMHIQYTQEYREM